ncbi:DUF2333 family protein [Oleispirillum naphthae]|uniref:DUF2333 family protein n=1 Tax=Oleispirillum naphthae TaxID=2838853 RepID=UPI00308242CC
MPNFEDFTGRVRGAFSAVRKRANLKDGIGRLNRGAGPWRMVKWVVAVVAVAALLYYPIGMAVFHKINDDPDFAPGEVAAGQSRAVAVAAELIRREVADGHWIPNDPFFFPTAALDNMPNFQTGLFAALSRFAVELSDQLGRTRGSSQVDPDLEKAVGLLKYPGNVWIFNFSTSLMPTASSESQYLAARRALVSYNERLGVGKAVFERRADNLIATLERIGNDMGSASALLDRRIEDGGGLIFDRTSDDVFYQTKGRLYGYYLILRELGADFAAVIKDKELTSAWEQMLGSFRVAATLDPLMVSNCAPDAQLCPSHLAAQGFYLLRSRTQLQEVANILLK